PNRSDLLPSRIGMQLHHVRDVANVKLQRRMKMADMHVNMNRCCREPSRLSLRPMNDRAAPVRAADRPAVLARDSFGERTVGESDRHQGVRFARRSAACRECGLAAERMLRLTSIVHGGLLPFVPVRVRDRYTALKPLCVNSIDSTATSLLAALRSGPDHL